MAWEPHTQVKDSKTITTSELPELPLVAAENGTDYNGLNESDAPN